MLCADARDDPRAAGLQSIDAHSTEHPCTHLCQHSLEQWRHDASEAVQIPDRMNVDEQRKKEGLGSKHCMTRIKCYPSRTWRSTCGSGNALSCEWSHVTPAEACQAAIYWRERLLSHKRLPCCVARADFHVTVLFAHATKPATCQHRLPTAPSQTTRPIRCFCLAREHDAPVHQCGWCC